MGWPSTGCVVWAKLEEIGGNCSQTRVQGNQQSRPEAQDDCPGHGVETEFGVGWMVKVMRTEQIGLA